MEDEVGGVGVDGGGLARGGLVGVRVGLEGGEGGVRGVRGARRRGEEACERRKGMVVGVGVVGDSRCGVRGLVELGWWFVQVVVAVVVMNDVLIGRLMVLSMRVEDMLPVEVLFFWSRQVGIVEVESSTWGISLTSVSAFVILE